MKRLGVVAILTVLAAGCGPQVDLKKSLQVTDVLGGYYDAGVVDGRNKIVPSITFTIHKNTSSSIHPLQLNVYFRQLPLPGTTPADGKTESKADSKDSAAQSSQAPAAKSVIAPAAWPFPTSSRP